MAVRGKYHRAGKPEDLPDENPELREISASDASTGMKTRESSAMHRMEL
jgi:hypothetical protein